jgi:hypothetical protein
MTTFYDHDGIVITDRSVRVGDRRYPLDSLRRLHVSRAPARRRSRGVTIVCLGMPVAGFVDAAAGGRLAVAVLALLALSGLAAVIRRRRRAYLLWADYQGCLVRLYHTDDRTELGKVSRALARAATHRRTSPAYVVRLTAPNLQRPPTALDPSLPAHRR